MSLVNPADGKSKIIRHKEIKMKNWRFPLVTLVIASVILSLVSISLTPGPTEAAPVGPAALSGGEPITLMAGRGVATFRIGPPQISPWRLQSTTFIVNYLAAGTTNRFGDSCLAWPADAQTAFTYAANLWGALLNSSVPIKINACWAHLSSGVLGHSGAAGFYRDFAGAPQANTWYSVALANALGGADLNGSANAEMDIAYSNNGINWYFGTDGNTPISQYDFVSVVLHEITHGLNFAGSMWVSGGQGSWGLETSPPYRPLVYDRFAEDGNGVSLLNTSTYPNPSAALASALTGHVGGVFFDGTNADAANGGSRVQLYTPSTWQSGSSYSHLAEIFNGTPNALMTYSLNDGESIHSPGPVTCGILQDMGWPGGCASVPNAPSNLNASALSQTRIKLTWNDNSSDESGFKVERSPDGSTSWSQIGATLANVAVYTDTNLTCNTPYYYRVRAYNTGGDSNYSNIAHVTTSACPLAPDVAIQKQVLGSNHKPGDPITFTLTISNIGNKVASQVVVTDSLPSQVLTPSFASTLLITPTGGAKYVWNVGKLNIGQSGVITIYGKIDPRLPAGTVFVNSAAVSDLEDISPGNNTSRATVGERKVYLPIVMQDWPPVPAVPVLNAISNSDGDGNYSVSWNAAARADTYTLQEDDNTGFSSPATVYGPGTALSWSATGKPNGTYYYRVKATNSYGDSGWSSVQPVSVQPPSGPTPGYWMGSFVDFYVTSDGANVSDFGVYVTLSGCGNYRIYHTTPVPISNNQFSFSGALYASGAFHSSESASGTVGLTGVGPICGQYWNGGPWTWDASWQYSAQTIFPVAHPVPEPAEMAGVMGIDYAVTRIK
jgi:uncharacterized repeat protein (TIGR01451 family)